MESQKRIYKIWHGMMSRCYNTKNTQYCYYGERGITVCKSWHNVTNFIHWALKNGYKDGLSIERKNVNGNYKPSNCCWIPRSEQAYNRRTTRNITINGITKPASLWAKEVGITREAFQKRLNSGWSGNDLMNPIAEQKSHKKITRKSIDENEKMFDTNYAREQFIKILRNGDCPICGKTNFKVILLHIQQAHKISRKELKYELSIPVTESFLEETHKQEKRMLALKRGLGTYIRGH